MSKPKAPPHGPCQAVTKYPQTQSYYRSEHCWHSKAPRQWNCCNCDWQIDERDPLAKNKKPPAGHGPFHPKGRTRRKK